MQMRFLSSAVAVVHLPGQIENQTISVSQSGNRSSEIVLSWTAPVDYGDARGPLDPYRTSITSFSVEVFSDDPASSATLELPGAPISSVFLNANWSANGQTYQVYVPPWIAGGPQGRVGFRVAAANPLFLGPYSPFVNASMALCGNGLLEEGEACDDGNYVYGDGCNPVCQKKKKKK
ncbi:hypothetical protein T484DRAFT_1775630 [Baffinella frigidus]|nr:hypothetical protein T484DRAFT_1775630 [Cryptophyta sp. CCMP2293]